MGILCMVCPDHKINIFRSTHSMFLDLIETTDLTPGNKMLKARAKAMKSEMYVSKKDQKWRRTCELHVQNNKILIIIAAS